MHLTSPSFNVMGESSDTVAQVEAVRKRFPDSSYLAMVGISAGSGLLVTYLGKVNLIALSLYCRDLRVFFSRRGIELLCRPLPPSALPMISLGLSGFPSNFY